MCLSHIASYEEIALGMYTGKGNKGKLIESNSIFSVFKINDSEKDFLAPSRWGK